MMVRTAKLSLARIAARNFEGHAGRSPHEARLCSTSPPRDAWRGSVG
jgi:hypothetical protein